jgi:hypothetical protein
MCTNTSVLKAEQKMHQVQDLLEVATISAHQIHPRSHDPVKIVKREGLNTLKGFFTMIQGDFGFDGAEDIDPKLPEADIHHPKDELVSDRLISVVTVYPCQHQLQLPGGAEKISDLAATTEILAAKDSISKKHLVCGGLVESQLIPVQP